VTGRCWQSFLETTISIGICGSVAPEVDEETKDYLRRGQTAFRGHFAVHKKVLLFEGDRVRLFQGYPGQ
jgi:hypothetical protein